MRIVRVHQYFILLALVAVSGYAGIMDLRTRIVTRNVVIASYVLAVVSNVFYVLYYDSTHAGLQQTFTPAGNGGFYSIAVAYPVSKEAAADVTGVLAEALSAHAGQYLVATTLSAAGLVMWKSRMLAGGDAIAIPAFLFTLAPIAPSPNAIVAYYILAVSSVLIVSVANNLRNNMRYRDKLYGSVWHRTYLMTFCRYGDGTSARHAFVYGDARRDYDNEQFYSGSEKTWLMPGLPLLAGFAPAVIAVLAFMPVLHLH